jgi:hypothetical protein
MTVKDGSYGGTNHIEGTPVNLTATHIGYIGDVYNPFLADCFKWLYVSLISGMSFNKYIKPNIFIGEHL